MSWIFALGGQSIGASASASVLLVNIQGLYPVGLTGWISLQSKGLSRVFSITVVQKHQFFGIQPSLWSNSHIHKIGSTRLKLQYFVPLAVVLPRPARGAGTLIPSAQCLVWAAKQALGNAALGALFA